MVSTRGYPTLSQSEGLTTSPKSAPLLLPSSSISLKELAAATGCCCIESSRHQMLQNRMYKTDPSDERSGQRHIRVLRSVRIYRSSPLEWRPTPADPTTTWPSWNPHPKRRPPRSERERQQAMLPAMMPVGPPNRRQRSQGRRSNQLAQQWTSWAGRSCPLPSCSGRQPVTESRGLIEREVSVQCTLDNR